MTRISIKNRQTVKFHFNSLLFVIVVIFHEQPLSILLLNRVDALHTSQLFYIYKQCNEIVGKSGSRLGSRNIPVHKVDKVLNISTICSPPYRKRL